MDVIKCIKERRSIRRFTGEKIPREIIDEIVDAAAFAPSWKNSQTTRYIVIDDRKLIDKIAEECVMGFKYNEKTLKNAQALVIVNSIVGVSGFEKNGEFATTKEDRWQNFDAGIAVQTFCLAAHEKGVGSVILGYFDEFKTAELVEIPDNEIIMAFIAIGRPEHIGNPPIRLTSKELVSYVGDEQ